VHSCDNSPPGPGTDPECTSQRACRILAHLTRPECRARAPGLGQPRDAAPNRMAVPGLRRSIYLDAPLALGPHRERSTGERC
jgi:hypothetical protein